MQAGAFLRAGVSEDLAPIGETEFANGMAAMSAKFREMGEQVYVEAEKGRESNRVL